MPPGLHGRSVSPAIGASRLARRASQPSGETRRGPIGNDWGVDGVRDQEPGEQSARRSPAALRRRLLAADSAPGTVGAARFIRRLLPGDDRYGDALSTAGERVPERLGRVLSEARSERPSAIRELGLGALQAWQALAEAQGRGRGRVDLAILFTDIVKFSEWALESGDEAALELLREVAAREDAAISGHGGRLVKRLGDGSMSVFDDAADAVRAALQAQGAIPAIEVDGYSPELRAGVHLGRPRRVGGDYLGVDVNIAARVADAASEGEVLVSAPVLERLDAGRFEARRRRRFRAKGAPKDLQVYSVRPRR
jgi:class 3 adenylate cyclase